MYKLILASRSPRRAEILKNANLSFHTFSVEISENLSENISLDAALEELSRRKASAVIETYSSQWSSNTIVLAADTIVVLGKDILGKPKDREQARQYLRRLSGCEHEVKTAFCLWNLKTNEIYSEVCKSRVSFRLLDNREIEIYLDSGEPYDKAGAYGIQGHGRTFVQSYTNSFFTIMGLPIERLLEVLKEKSWQIQEG